MPPTRSNSTNIPLTYQQNPKVIDMPNVVATASAEAIRLQMLIIKDVTNLIEFDYENFASIDYMPDASNSNELIPGNPVYKEHFNNIVKEIDTKLGYGKTTSSAYLSHYRGYFSLLYGNDGIPIIKFSLPISDNMIDDFSIVQNRIGFPEESGTDV